MQYRNIDRDYQRAILRGTVRNIPRIHNTSFMFLAKSRIQIFML